MIASGGGAARGLAARVPAVAGALLFAGALYLYRGNLVPPFYQVFPWDELYYIAQARQLLAGNFIPFGGFPLPALFYAPLLVITQGHAASLLLADWLGRLLLFGLLLTVAGLVGREVREHAHPLVLAGALLASAVLPTLLTNASDALYCAFSGLALWQTLAFRRDGRLRRLAAASAGVGIAALARTDGLVLWPVLLGLGVVVWASRRPRPAGPVRALLWPLGVAGVPFATIVGGYLLLGAIATSDVHTGTSIRSYFTFEFAQGWVYRDRYGSWIEAYDAGFAEARRLYGTPEENRHSVLRAVLRNPPAFTERVAHQLRQAPGAVAAAYGGAVGVLLLGAAGIGLLHLLRRREYVLASVSVLWAAPVALYLAFSFGRVGYVLLPCYPVLLLSAVGLTAAAGTLIARGSGWLRVGLLGALLAAGAVAWISLREPPAASPRPVAWAHHVGFDMGLESALALAVAVLLIVWLSRRGRAAQAFPSLGLLAVVVALRFGTAYPVPPGIVLSTTGEELAAGFLQQHVRRAPPPQVNIAASAPAVSWAAQREWHLLLPLAMRHLQTEDDLRRWVREGWLDAIYLDYWTKAWAPDFYALAEREIGRDLVVAFSLRDERPERERFLSPAMPAGTDVEQTFRVLVPRRSGG